MCLVRRGRSPVEQAAHAARFVILVLSGSLGAPCHADEASAWNVSGFGTVGATVQSGGDGWGFLRSNAQSGAASDVSASQDSRLGVQVNWRHGPQWDAALQAVAAQRPDGVPLHESIKWAYLGYRPLANTRIRIGRTSPDMFLYADSQDVGYALPWARPPVDFYGFSPVASVDGLDAEQRWSSAEATWRARLSAGSVSVTVNDGQGNAFPVRGREVLALGLSREEGGLVLKASYLGVRLRAGEPATLLQLRDSLSQIAALPVPGVAQSIAPLQENLWVGGRVSYVGLGIQFDRGPWGFISEISSLSVPGSPLNADRAYVSVSFRQGPVSYYGLVSRVVPRKPAPAVPDLITPLTPVIGAEAAAGAQQLADNAGLASIVYRYDQRTIGAGLRWDLLPNAALKFQADHFKVHANGAAGWRNRDARAASGTLYSVLFDFVWGQ